MTDIRVGLFPPVADPLADGADDHQKALECLTDAGVDHLCVGDHVSFVVGAGSDGLITATSLLATQATLPVYVAVYLLPLRHPVTVARQLSTIAQLHPGRLTLGVGIGGEDRHESEICGVDPATRGRRMDEHLHVLRDLATGASATFDGEFVALRDAVVVPAPSPPIPIVVGGRSSAAVTRAARFGDGWLGIWVSPRRYADVTADIARQATEVGRDPGRFEHGLNVWCGFGATAAKAREPLATRMQAFYGMPFEPFERYSPYGPPDQVAEFLQPYVDAGCSAFNLIPCARDVEAGIAAVSEVRTLLGSSHRDTPTPHECS
jgi:alkanesulfonate monooxygenase SsuD/methylene tetrahydromethanopterin reductase-like flavin-dependent oxidoreductase (luciferase family)